MTPCINCGRRVWWWQRQGWRVLHFGRGMDESAFLRWHSRCEYRP